MPTGRRRQFTSSVKQLLQLSTMRILSRYESPNACSTAIFCIGSVYRKARLFIDVQKYLKRNNFERDGNIRMRFSRNFCWLISSRVKYDKNQNSNPIFPISRKKAVQLLAKPRAAFGVYYGCCHEWSVPRESLGFSRKRGG